MIMELDELRRHWRESPSSPITSLTALTGLLGKSTTSMVDRLRRNLWNEMVSSGLTALLMPLSFPMLPHGVVLGLAGALGLPVLALGVYYYQQFQLLKRMGQTDVSLRGHLYALCAGLRQLLRFYYNLTLWTGPVTLIVVLSYYLAREIERPAGPRWPKLSLVVAAALVLGVLVQAGITRFTRYYLQRRYGQHLDRLEGQLRELDDSEPLGRSGSPPDFTG